MNARAPWWVRWPEGWVLFLLWAGGIPPMEVARLMLLREEHTGKAHTEGPAEPKA